MTVDARPKAGAVVSAPDPEPVPAIESTLPSTEFQGDRYVDSDDFQRDIDEKEGKRFYVVPDGSGGRQLLEAAAIGAGMAPAIQVEDIPGPLIWQVCRVIVPLLKVDSASRYDLSFPATDKEEVVYAGYLLSAQGAAKRATIRAYVRQGMRAFPVLARVDDQGRVVSIVNNMPTQSIPETSFRYASLGGTVALHPVSGIGYALLDGARLREKLPATCGMQQIADDVSAGLVTVQFSESGEQ